MYRYKFSKGLPLAIAACKSAIPELDSASLLELESINSGSLTKSLKKTGTVRYSDG